MTEAIKRSGRKTRIESAKARIEQAEIRTEQAETRTEQAKTRADQAEARTEQAETRTEQAKTRAESAETRTELAESRTEEAEITLQRVFHAKMDPGHGTSKRLLQENPALKLNGKQDVLDNLTPRQRAILRLIAEGKNTKQAADILKVSPKTIEYHRKKLMACLNTHDVPGLVRFALRVGLISLEA